MGWNDLLSQYSTENQSHVHSEIRADEFKQIHNNVLFCWDLVAIYKFHYNQTKSRIILVDFGGSDGRSVITKQFAKKSHPKPLKMRRNEADIIGYQLVRFQKFIAKFRKGKNLDKFEEYNKGGIRYVFNNFLSPFFSEFYYLLYNLCE